MTENASILFKTPRPWFGSQRLGAFAISLDGKKAGLLMPQGSLAVSCSSGRHRIRARQWYYLSPRVEVDVASGQTVELSVDLVRQGSLFRRWLTLVFLPWRGVAITTQS